MRCVAQERREEKPAATDKQSQFIYAHLILKLFRVFFFFFFLKHDACMQKCSLGRIDVNGFFHALRNAQCH